VSNSKNPKRGLVRRITRNMRGGTQYSTGCLNTLLAWEKDLLLLYFSGLQEKEIAKVLYISQQVLRHRIKLAHEKMHDEIEPLLVRPLSFEDTLRNTDIGVSQNAIMWMLVSMAQGQFERFGEPN